MMTFGNALKLRRGGTWIGGGDDPDPTVLFSDDFEGHSLGAGTPSGWTNITASGSPAWAITDSNPLTGTKSLLASSGGANAWRLNVTGLSVADVELSLKWRRVEHAEVGGVFHVRYVDENNRIFAYFPETGRVQLGHRISGVTTTLAYLTGVPTTVPMTHEVKLKAVGSQVTLTVISGGVTRVGGFSTTHLSAGTVGLTHSAGAGGTSTSLFDDVVVTGL